MKIRTIIAVGAMAAGAASYGARAVVAVPTANANERLAVTMAAPYGWSGQQAVCLIKLWTSEDSTWNPGQWNLAGSGAYGIPQALPAEKMATAGRNWRTSPATQVKWGLGYIKSTYGKPCTAWAFKKANGWY